MDRQTLQFAVISLLGILAISTAASTLRTPISSGSTGSGSGTGSGGASAPPEPDSAADFSIPFLSEILLVLLGLFALLLAIAIIAVIIGGLWFVIRYRSELISSFPAMAIFILGAVIAIIVFWWLAGAADPAPVDSGGAGGGESPDGEGTEQPNPLPTVVLGSVLVVLVVLAAMMLAPRLSDRIQSFGLTLNTEAASSDSSEPVDERERTPEAENALENEVYRAWRALTDELDVQSPNSTTPQEFASAAVDAGLHPDDVRELTRLFEDVRYGRYDPTGEREQIAVSLRRRIEDAGTRENR